MKKKTKKQGKKTKNSQQSLSDKALVDSHDEIELIPTTRVTQKFTIPQQIELVRSHGCSRSEGLGRRFIPVNKYHPWSVTRKCSRSSLLSSVAWNPSRIRNTILAVGPGTPASILWKSRNGDSVDNLEEANRQNALMEQLEFNDDDDDSMVTHESDFDDEEDEFFQDNSEHYLATNIDRDGSQQDEDEDDDSAQRLQQQQQEQAVAIDWLPFMRHNGCVNTACWLNCPWRLSPADGGMSLSSGDQVLLPKAIVSCYETPTQVMTSGDDCMIKVWDVQNAMGSASLLSGGWDTFSPLATANAKDLGSDKQHKIWKNYYRQRDGICKVAGSVSLLASVHSKHRGNVFHVSPIGDAPGKVLSCGADGHLRLSDLESASSTVVINPHVHDDIGEELSDLLGGAFGVIAFSHLSLTGNTGLLCSQRGLFRYDVRLPPTLQHRRSLLEPIAPGASRSLACKACAVWSPSYFRCYDSYPLYINSESEPSYIFAGLTNGYVELLDLRMLGGSSHPKVLQRYCPNELADDSNASVSGIDVSKDGRELLVSYENDQIYTFPVLHDVACYSAGPTLKELEATSKIYTESKSKYVPQLALYGGHLNRRTFLKNATYAGPNDEYILTGSDSGKAWIYERSTACVAALLSADCSTCNGIVAHPTLPLFVTYGIDTTAKLWRACATQDSATARAKASIEMSEYELSTVSRHWNRVQSSLHRFVEKEVPVVLPDLIASDELLGTSRFDTIMMDIGNGYQMGKPLAEYGNALRCLSPLLRQNKHSCFRAVREGRMPPISQMLPIYAVVVSWNRLRLQATSLGMDVNPWAPWIFESKIALRQMEELVGFHRSDLVPDNPSDWILYDPDMILGCCIKFHCLFNIDNYLEVLQRNFPENPVFFGSIKPFKNQFFEKHKQLKLPWLTDERWQHRHDYKPSNIDEKTEFAKKWSRSILEDTIAVLKEGGNEAMKLGLFYKAAYRYDKAIQYCAVAFMEHSMGLCLPPTHPDLYGSTHLNQSGFLVHLTRDRGLPSAFIGTKKPEYKYVLIKKGTSTLLVWSSTLQVLIASRLNLSLLLLKPEYVLPGLSCKQAVLACEQVREALRLLHPFVKCPGKVVAEGNVNPKSGAKPMDKGDFRKDEPITTYQEAMALQAKAYFRLGCAQSDLGDYKEAVKSFGLSLECSQKSRCDDKGNVTGTTKSDPLVLRRLHEAKIKWKETKKGKKSSK